MLLSFPSPFLLWLRAVLEGCLINKIHSPRSLFLIGQVEPLPHSGACDAASSRILHVRLFLFLAESLAVALREKAGFATSRECRTHWVLSKNTSHPGGERRARAGCLSLSLSHAFSMSFSSVSVSLSVSLPLSPSHTVVPAHTHSMHTSPLCRSK